MSGKRRGKRVTASDGSVGVHGKNANGGGRQHRARPALGPPWALRRAHRCGDAGRTTGGLRRECPRRLVVADDPRDERSPATAQRRVAGLQHYPGSARRTARWRPSPPRSSHARDRRRGVPGHTSVIPRSGEGRGIHRSPRRLAARSGAGTAASASPGHAAHQPVATSRKVAGSAPTAERAPHASTKARQRRICTVSQSCRWDPAPTA